jgi:hypothetical protein
MESQMIDILSNCIVKSLNLFAISIEPEKNRINIFKSSSKEFKKNQAYIPSFIIFSIIVVNNNSTSNRIKDDINSLDFGDLVSIVLSPTIDEFKNQMREIMEFPTNNMNNIPQIESLLLTAKSSFLKIAKPDILMKSIEAIMSLIDYRVPEINSILLAYLQFESIIKNDPGHGLDENSKLDEFDEPFRLYKKTEDDLIMLSEKKNSFPPFILDCSHAKNVIMHLCKTGNFLLIFIGLNKIRNILSKRITILCKQMLSLYDDMNFSNNENTDKLNLDAYKKLELSLERSIIQSNNFTSQFSTIRDTWDLLYEHESPLSAETDNIYWRVYKWPRRSESEQALCKEKLSLWRDEIVKFVSLNCEKVLGIIIKLNNHILSIKEYADSAKFELVLKTFEQFENEETNISTCVDFNKNASILLRTEEFKFKCLEETVNIFNTYKSVWEFAKDTKQYISMCKEYLFMDVNGEQILIKISGWNQIIQSLTGAFLPGDSAYKLLYSINQEVIDFTLSTKVITYLRNPSLTERHWVNILKITGLSQLNVCIILILVFWIEIRSNSTFKLKLSR